MNSWMNLIKETFINGKGGHHIIIDSVCLTFMLYATQAYRLLLEKSTMLSLSRDTWSRLNNIQQGGADALKD